MRSPPLWQSKTRCIVHANRADSQCSCCLRELPFQVNECRLELLRSSSRRVRFSAADLPRRKGIEAVSTSTIQVEARPSWKEEVNRRLAEHQGRKGGSPSQAQPQSSASSNASRRAQAAAARVAARYAQAPSYSEVLAAEARAALRAAEAASQAALEAHAAVQSVLAGIEAAAGIEPPPMLELVEASVPLQLGEPAAGKDELELEPLFTAAAAEVAAAAEAAAEPVLSMGPVEPLSIRWERELPARSAIEPAELHEIRGNDPFQEQWWKLAGNELLAASGEAIEAVEPAQPIQGNVIEFPRELVATRKARPRLVESAAAEDEAGVQLSIFGIDPGALPAEPMIEAAAVAAPAEAWTAPRWSGIELDAQPLDERDALQVESGRAQQAMELEPATAGWRLLAICMDAALILSAVFGAGIVALHKSAMLPRLHTAEIAAACAVVLLAGVYQVLFFLLGQATPGMRYAHLELSTLEGNLPTRGQRSARLLAMLLSVLPGGLGLAWAIFDENNLAWHDRLSGTYLRRG